MNQFFRNVTSNFGIAGIEAIVFILLTPYVVHKLGIADYAVWVLIEAVAYFLGFFDVGIPEAQVRQHARLRRLGRLDAIGRLHGTVITVFLGAGTLAFIVAVVFAVLPTASLLDIPESALPLYVPLFALIGLSVLLAFVESALDGIFEGNERFDAVNRIDVALTLLDAALVVLVLSMGHGLLALAALEVATTALAILIKWRAVKRLFPIAAAPQLGFHRESWRSISNFSWWNCLNEFTTEGTAQLVKLIIPMLLGSALLTPYSLVVALAAGIFVIAEPISDIFLPVSASRHAANDRHGLTALQLRGTKLVTLFTLPVTLVVLFFGRDILDLWVGAEYTNVSDAFLWLVAADFFFSTFLWTSLNILIAAGDMKRVFWMSLFEVAVSFVLILLLAPSLGLPGLALAALIANVATGLLLFLPRACALTNLEVPRLLWSGLIVRVLCVLPAAAVGYYLSTQVDLPGWLGTGFAALITAAIAGAGLVFLASTPRERARYWVSLRRVARA